MKLAMRDSGDILEAMGAAVFSVRLREHGEWRSESRVGF